MKLLTFKISKSLLEEMDQAFKDHHYANRTEFIREAIREKIKHCQLHKHKLQGKKAERMDYTG